MLQYKLQRGFAYSCHIWGNDGSLAGVHITKILMGKMCIINQKITFHFVGRRDSITSHCINIILQYMMDTEAEYVNAKIDR